MPLTCTHPCHRHPAPKLGYDIVCYRDMPESIPELAAEICTAKAALRAKGLKLS